MVHTDFALRRPVTTLMVFVAVSLIGIISAALLPLELFPDIRFPGLQVRIPYAGSTPDEVEELITRPAEEAISTLSGIKELRSTSTETGAELIVLFDWDRDPAAVAFEVRTKLESIRHLFPPAADRIQTNLFAAGDARVVAVRLAGKEDLSRQYEMLERYLKRPLERIDGVARVSLEGVEPLELRVLVDPVRVAAYGVDVRQLRQKLERANFSVSGGEITEAGQRLSVRPIGEFRDLADVRNFLVQGNVRLSDIAEVSLVSPELAVGRHLNGRPGVGLDVFKATGFNIVDVSDRAMEAIEKAQQAPQLQGIDVIVLLNQAENIRMSLRELRNAGLIGAALALVVLFTFLRDWPTTLIVSLAVPFSLVITLAAMYFLGFSLNILTMMGMMLAVGLLVDNAVVTTESIFRHRQLNPDHPIAATLSGVREVGTAVLAGTLSTIIVFLPIVFGEKNQMSVFMVHVAVPIVVAMLASLLVAQTIIPTLTARFPSPPPVKAGSRFARLQDWYERRLEWVLQHPRKTVGLVLVILVSPAPLFASGLLKVDMFPQDASDRLQLPYHIEGSYPLARVEQAVDRVEAYLDQNRERFGIDLVYSYYTPDDAASVIRLKPRDELPMEPRDIMAQIEKEMPEIIIGNPSFRFEENQGGSTGFSLQLSGESTLKLVSLSRDLVGRLAQIEGFDSVRTTAKSGEQELQVRIDRERAQALGISARDIGETLNLALAEQRFGYFLKDGKQYFVIGALVREQRDENPDLRNLDVPSRSGRAARLDSVADLIEQISPPQLFRFNRYSSATVSAALQTGYTLSQGVQAMEAIGREILDESFETDLAGEGRDLRDTSAGTLFAFVFALALIYFVLAAQFESFRDPLAILLTVPLALVGAVGSLWLHGQTLNIFSEIGMIMLIGLVTKNGILIVEFANQQRARGLPPVAAAREAAVARFRPVLMTSISTILGILPIALALGAGSESRRAMGIAVVGGLVIGTALTLLVIPAIYTFLTSRHHVRRSLEAE